MSGHDWSLRLAAEDFLYGEAELLDRWRLEEWLDLFAPTCTYLVPATDLPDGDPSSDLFLIQDDRFLLEQRVRSLLTRSAHAEHPHSRTRRSITNVRATRAGETVSIRANFSITRIRSATVDVYVGEYDHEIDATVEGDWRFRVRRAVLDLEALRPQGKVSIVL